MNPLGSQSSIEPPTSARGGHAGDGPSGVGGLGSIAVLEIHRDRQIRGPGERPRMVDDLIQAHLAVGSTERLRETAARARECLEAELRQRPSRPRVPGGGDNERVAHVQGPKLPPFSSWELVIVLSAHFRIRAPQASREARSAGQGPDAGVDAQPAALAPGVGVDVAAVSAALARGARGDDRGVAVDVYDHLVDRQCR
jgi:hypothetical protein